jgi:hypothetical protein
MSLGSTDNSHDIARSLESLPESRDIGNGYWLTAKYVEELVKEASDGRLMAIPLDDDGEPGLESPVQIRCFGVNIPTLQHHYKLALSGRSAKDVGDFYIAGNFIFPGDGIVELLRNVLNNQDDANYRAKLDFFCGSPGHAVTREPKDRGERHPRYHRIPTNPHGSDRNHRSPYA